MKFFFEKWKQTRRMKLCVEANNFIFIFWKRNEKMTSYMIKIVIMSYDHVFDYKKNHMI